MYSTKSIHKNINPNYPQTYITIGDPFRSSLQELPERWKKKQFVAQRHPKISNNFKYVSDKYTEQAEPYSKTQPLETRKLGFGSKDAFKSGQFTSTKATERYRSVLRKEKRLMDKHRNKANEDTLLEKYGSKERKAPKDKQGNNLKEPKYLYDIGRTHETAFDPKTVRDSFYKIPKHAAVDPKLKGQDPIRRMGNDRPMSATYGETAWKYNYGNPKFGQIHSVDKFYDKGHLACMGF